MLLDIKTLTLGEVAKIEELSGQSFTEFGGDNKPVGLTLAAIAFVAKRREQLAAGTKPTYTWNDALGLTFAEANDLIDFGEDEYDEASPAVPAEAPADEAPGEPDPAVDPTGEDAGL